MGIVENMKYFFLATSTILIIVLLFLFFFIRNTGFHNNKKFISIFYENEALNIKNPYSFIAHAGGSIDNHLYTNSLEAVERSISLGYHLIELDLIESSDFFFVAAHDWEYFKKINTKLHAKINDKPLSLSDFNSYKIFDKYHGLDEFKINKIFNENKDLFLVTDKTRNFKKIFKTFKFNDRILVEVFSYFDYIKSILHGISNPILSIKDDITILDRFFINFFNINLLALHSQNVINNKNVLDNFNKHNKIIFIYSSNDFKFINENINSFSSIFYSDYWDIKSSKCLIANNDLNHDSHIHHFQYKKCLTY